MDIIKACDTCGSTKDNCCECEDKRKYYSEEYIKKIINNIDYPSYDTMLSHQARDFNSFKRGTYSGINYFLEQIKKQLNK